MIEPKHNVVVTKRACWEGSSGYAIETKDLAIFEFLKEFGKVEGRDRYSKYFYPYGLYDPDDIRDMLYSLDKPPPTFFEKVAEMVRGLKEYDGETIETMRVGQRAYTLPWALADPLTLTWDYIVTSKKCGTSDMPIMRISSDTWEVKPATSCFWQVVCVKKR